MNPDFNDQQPFRSVALLIEDILRQETEHPVMPRCDGGELRGLIDGPLPQESASLDELLAEVRAVVLPHVRRNGHPRFFGYVSASVDPIGVAADAICSAMNQNVTAWRSAPSATQVERTTIRWIDELVGFAGEGNGMFVGGGSAANMTAIACAVLTAEDCASPEPPGRANDRDAHARERMTLYVSTQGHLSLMKAARTLGLLDDHVRRVEVDGDRRMAVSALRERLQEDTAAGLVPVCVCASAGTVNTGAIDPLEDVAAVCGEFGVWFHIDGAYGAPAAMTEEYAWLRRGFAEADSLSLDPHKWLFAPLDVGCILFRDAHRSRRAFSMTSEYIEVDNTNVSGTQRAAASRCEDEGFAFFDHGLDLSRRFRALKVWMILKARGAKGLAEVITRNIALRRRLDERVTGESCLEPLGSGLSISCFRYVPTAERGVVGDTEASRHTGKQVRPDSPERLNQLNEQILKTLVREGGVFMSPTVLDGRYALRVCIVNFRTTAADVDWLVSEVLRIGHEIGQCD